MEREPGYLIRMRGHVEGSDLNRMSPVQIHVLESGETCSLLSVQADQSGLIGLLRHLHGLGFRLLSVESKLTDENNLKQGET